MMRPRLTLPRLYNSPPLSRRVFKNCNLVASVAMRYTQHLVAARLAPLRWFAPGGRVELLGTVIIHRCPTRLYIGPNLNNQRRHVVAVLAARQREKCHRNAVRCTCGGGCKCRYCGDALPTSGSRQCQPGPGAGRRACSECQAGCGKISTSTTLARDEAKISI